MILVGFFFLFYTFFFLNFIHSYTFNFSSFELREWVFPAKLYCQKDEALTRKCLTNQPP